MKCKWIPALMFMAACSAPQAPTPADESIKDAKPQSVETHSALVGEEGSVLPPPARKVVKDKPKPVIQRVVIATPTARGVVLLESELEAVHKSLEARLQEDLLFEVVAHSALDDEIKVLKKGKLPNQKACKVLPDPFQAAAGFEGAKVVWPSLACSSERCTLMAQSGPERRVFELSTDPDAWAEELAEAPLVDKEVQVVGASTVLGKTKEPYLVLEDVDGAWDEAFQKPLQRAASRAKRCDEHTGRFLISVAESGKISACETDRRHVRKPKSEDCFCKALKRVKFPKAEKDSGERRFSGRLKVLDKDLNRKRALNQRATLELVSSDDPIAHLNTVHLKDSALHGCADLIDSETKVGFVLEVAGQGEHVAHSTSWTGDVSADVKSCVKALLRGVTMDCPANERATVRGQITLRPE